jgi:hypothetical protein
MSEQIEKVRAHLAELEAKEALKNNQAQTSSNLVLNENAEEEAGGIVTYLWPIVLPALVSTILLSAYHFWVNQKTSIAVVDVSEVMAIQQSQFVKLLSSGTVTDKQREDSFAMVAGFGDRLKAAIDSVQKDCRCTLIVKNAVIGEVSDYTDSLKAKMGMAGLKADDGTKNEASQQNGGVAIFPSAQEDMLKGLR